MASTTTLLAYVNRVEIPRYRKGLPVTCDACTREGLVDAKPMSIWEWVAHARTAYKWSLPPVEPCLLCGHFCALGSGFQRHFTTQYSDNSGKPLECAVCVASTMPAGEVPEIDGFKELLRHAMEKRPSGQAVPNAVGGKRKRDGDMDAEYTAPAAKRKDGDMNREYIAPAAKRKRTAKHNVAYTKNVTDGADSDLCEDVIICAPIMDSDSLEHVDPALLAPWRPTGAAHHTAAVSSALQAQAALSRPRRRRGHRHG
ncbi:hypothetical protein VTK56DRAFT_4028 [Thermocarpiscus australiensis]